MGQYHPPLPCPGPDWGHRALPDEMMRARPMGPPGPHDLGPGGPPWHGHPPPMGPGPGCPPGWPDGPDRMGMSDAGRPPWDRSERPMPMMGGPAPRPHAPGGPNGQWQGPPMYPHDAGPDAFRPWPQADANRPMMAGPPDGVGYHMPMGPDGMPRPPAGPGCPGPWDAPLRPFAPPEGVWSPRLGSMPRDPMLNRPGPGLLEMSSRPPLGTAPGPFGPLGPLGLGPPLQAGPAPPQAHGQPQLQPRFGPDGQEIIEKPQSHPQPGAPVWAAMPGGPGGESIRPVVPRLALEASIPNAPIRHAAVPAATAAAGGLQKPQSAAAARAAEVPVAGAQEQLQEPVESGRPEQTGPEWAGCDQSPAKSTSSSREGGPDAAGQSEQAEEKASLALGEERRKVEDAAAEAAQALRAIAAEAEARVQAERQAATAEVLAQKACHDEAMARIQAELSELKAQAAARETMEASLTGAAMARIESELAELKAEQAKATARSVETIPFPVQCEQPEQATSPSAASAPSPEASAEAIKPVPEKAAETPRSSLEKTVIICEEPVDHKGSVAKADVSLDKTTVVNDDCLHESSERLERGSMASLDKTIAVDVPSPSKVAETTKEKESPEPLLFGSDVLQAVEKARAAVAELQRRAGINQDQEASRKKQEKQSPASLMQAPFCHDTVGLNVLLSQDGYTATRSCGCRESVAVCKAPLSQQGAGYFEVEVCQTVDGWIGGLGIGVTHSSPSDLKEQRLPDKAWRVPRSFVLGYAGNKYLNGKEGTVDWQSDQLRVGQRVGLLIDGGSLYVLVDGQEVASVSEVEMLSAGLRQDEPLYGIVDIYNAALSVRLLPGAVVPQK
ncbi:unnamed protein product [Symbiodinium sp. CCMP2456]|nr:unnamed protein product [Symbiodinium sp. CCMP2456]